MKHSTYFSKGVLAVWHPLLQHWNKDKNLDSGCWVVSCTAGDGPFFGLTSADTAQQNGPCWSSVPRPRGSAKGHWGLSSLDSWFLFLFKRNSGAGLLGVGFSWGGHTNCPAFMRTSLRGDSLHLNWFMSVHTEVCTSLTKAIKNLMLA